MTFVFGNTLCPPAALTLLPMSDAPTFVRHPVVAARLACPQEVTGSAVKLCFDDDQESPSAMSITFAYPGKIMFEMRIWNPRAMGGVENSVAVSGSEGLVEIGKSGRVNGCRVFDCAGRLNLTAL